MALRAPLLFTTLAAAQDVFLRLHRSDSDFHVVGKNVYCEKSDSGFEIFRSNLDADDCQAACLADPSCRSFGTYVNSTCDACVHYSTTCPEPLKTTCQGDVTAYAREGTASPPFDFTAFERQLLPRWLELFRVGPEPGNFTWHLPHRHGTSLYGTTDLVYTLFFVGQLDGFSEEDRQSWAGIIQSFQDPATGWFNPADWENQNKENWPWHPTHAAVETLALLGHAPLHPMAEVQRILEDRSSWEEFMDEYVANNTDIWGGSQQAQSLPGIMRSVDTDKAFEFYDFFFGYMEAHSDPATGYWSGKTPNAVKQLGGAFHFYKLYSCFGRAWPHAAAAVNATLASQDAESGMWRTHRGRTPGLSNCIDLDGIYSLTRSALLAADDEGVPYRWDAVRAACARYLPTAAAMLGHEAEVLLGKYARNTHIMHGALGAVAECQAFFPELVSTERPWRRANGSAATRSCAYA